MKKEIQKVPTIRFKGFTDDWEQRKLSALTSIFNSGKGIQSAEIKKVGLYPVYGGNGVRGYADRYNYDGEFALIGRQGALCGNMNYYMGKAYFTEHAIVVKASDNSNTRFLYYMLDTLKLGHYSDQSAQPGLAVNKLIRLTSAVPKLEEQKHIAEYLTNLDNLITLHKRKLKQLQTLKKYFLQNMFPAKKEKVPAIRFKGFTDDWEQRKLGDFLTISKIPGHTGINAKKLTVKLWGKGIVEKKDIYSGSENTQYYIRHTGQFMYGKLDFLHAAFGIVPKNLDKFESTLDSPAFDLNGIDSQFLLNKVIQKDFYLKQGLVANGSRKAKRIHENTFMAMPIIISSLEEQKKIGKYFVVLNDLITLHHRKCDQLQSLKKFMLQNLFIQRR